MYVKDMKRCTEKAMWQVKPDWMRCDYLVEDEEIISPESWECMLNPGMSVTW